MSDEHGVDSTRPLAIPAMNSALTVAVPLRLLASGLGSWFVRFRFHLRKRNPLWLLWNVVPGHTAYSRLQLVTVLSNQLALTFSSTVLWYGNSQCFLEQQLIASFVGASLSVIGCSLGRKLFALAQGKDWSTYQQGNAKRTTRSHASGGKKKKRKGDRRKTVLPDWSRALVTSRISSGFRAVSDTMRLSRWRSSSSNSSESRFTWRLSSRSSRWSAPRHASSGTISCISSTNFDEVSELGLTFQDGSDSPTAASVVLGPSTDVDDVSDVAFIVQGGSGSLVVGSVRLGPDPSPDLDAHGLGLATREDSVGSARRSFVGFKKPKSSGGRSDEAPSRDSLVDDCADDLELPRSHPSRLIRARKANKQKLKMAGPVLIASPPPSPAPTSPTPASPTVLPSLEAETESQSALAEESSLSTQLHWIEKQVRWVEGMAEEPRSCPTAADAASLHPDAAKGGPQARNNLCELWLPLDRLHRSHHGWVLLVCVSAGAGDRGAQDPRDERETQPGPNPVIVPVHSVGVTVLSRLPRCMRPRAAELILVRVPAVDLATAGLQGDLTHDLSHSKLEAGGSLSHATPRSCSPMMLVAWAFNLAVLASCNAFLFYVVLVVFEEANAGWIQAVLLSTLLSVFLSVAVYDVFICAFVAFIPIKSSHSRSPLKICLQALLGACCD